MKGRWFGSLCPSHSTDRNLFKENGKAEDKHYFSQIIKAFFQRENPNMNVNIEDSEMTIFLGIMSTKVIKFAFQ